MSVRTPMAGPTCYTGTPLTIVRRPDLADAELVGSMMGGLTQLNVTPEFEKWARGFSGCDGGNPKGSIWLCGIEWGLGKEHSLEEELRTPVSEPPQIYKSSEDVLKSPEGRTYPF